MTDILDTIDATLADMSVSPDAMRWAPEGAPAPEYITRAEIAKWELIHAQEAERAILDGWRK